MTKLKRQGMPVDSVETARAWRHARQNIAARKPEPDVPRASVIVAHEIAPDGFDLNETHDEARTRREIAEANLAEMKEAEGRRTLVSAHDVRAAMANRVAAFRDALMQIPSRLVPILCAETDPAKIHAALDRELLQALSFVSGVSGEAA